MVGVGEASSSGWHESLGLVAVPNVPAGEVVAEVPKKLKDGCARRQRLQPWPRMWQQQRHPLMALAVAWHMSIFPEAEVVTPDAPGDGRWSKPVDLLDVGFLTML
ncbi:hypothetical protein ZWY2020_048404 [Hordeum vulgare]|nr:hypothetical protein ZWY2020_048404 [Hordeum vulgare]